jgi:hypothetical protein
MVVALIQINNELETIQMKLMRCIKNSMEMNSQPQIRNFSARFQTKNCCRITSQANCQRKSSYDSSDQYKKTLLTRIATSIFIKTEPTKD